MNEFNDEMFSGEQITGALGELADYERNDEIVTLAAGTYEPVVLELFAKLARALGTKVGSKYGSFCIIREKPLAERRESAISNLRRKAEKGEIIPAYSTESSIPSDDELDNSYARRHMGITEEN